MLQRHLTSATLLALLATAGCKPKSTEGDTLPSATVAPTPPPPPSVAPSAGAANAPDAVCAESVPRFTIAKGARGEAGGTLVRLADGRLAVGYVSGSAPSVAIVDLAGTVSKVDVDTAGYTLETRALEKGTSASIQRVTPLGASGLNMRVAIDAFIGSSDRSHRMRCGPAEVPALVGGVGASVALDASSADAASIGDGDVRDCRTFSDGAQVWVVGSRLGVGSGDGKAKSTWFVRGQEGDAGAPLATLATRSVADAKGDRYAFDVPASLSVAGVGYLFAGRLDGKIAYARASDGLAPAGDAQITWLGAVTGMPALASHERTVALIVPVSGKTDLYGAVFPIETAQPKLEMLHVDGDQVATGERNSVTLAFRPAGDVLVGFVEGAGTRRRARLAVLDATLKPKLPLYDVTGSEGNVTSVRMLALDDGKVLVVYLDAEASTLMGVVLSCKG